MIRAVLAMLLALVVLPLAVPAFGQDSMPPAPYAYNQLDDPRLEAEASALMHTLRCLKCQSQSIADSDAPMAGDMRHQVRSRILAGESPDQIRAWLIARYGDYVSYEPEISATTWPLFAIPVLVILIVAGVLLRRLGKRRAEAGEGA
jgi:cytochrome c-type biogenesis protein CcmH